MSIFRGRRITQRGGAAAGRGDDPHGVTSAVRNLRYSTPYFKQRAIVMARGSYGPNPYDTPAEKDARKEGYASDYQMRFSKAIKAHMAGDSSLLDEFEAQDPVLQARRNGSLRYTGR